MLVQLVSLQLTDFQAHAELTVDFAPGITSIIGPTDKGKSSILRALRWVAQNNLGGEEFIREGAKQTVVKLVVQDGKKRRTITRSKGKSNAYTLDGKEYLAFGQSVPTDIGQLLQLNEINFQGQHDSPFWFSETAGEVSRRLNSVIDLTIIDSTLSYIAGAVRRCTERRELCEERMEGIKKQLEELGPQRERVKDFEALKNKEIDYNQASKGRAYLNELLERVRCNAARELEQKAEAVEMVFSLARQAVQANRKLGDLRLLLSDIADAQSVKAPPPFEPASTAYDEWTKAEERTNGLASMIHRISEWRMNVDVKAGVVKLAEKTYHDKTKGEVCPLCGNQIQ